jgi:hypothetical protein
MDSYFALLIRTARNRRSRVVLLGVATIPTNLIQSHGDRGIWWVSIALKRGNNKKPLGLLGVVFFYFYYPHSPQLFMLVTIPTGITNGSVL